MSITITIYSYHTNRKSTYRNVQSLEDKFGEIVIKHGDSKLTILGSTQHRVFEVRLEE